MKHFIPNPPDSGSAQQGDNHCGASETGTEDTLEFKTPESDHCIPCGEYAREWGFILYTQGLPGGYPKDERWMNYSKDRPR